MKTVNLDYEILTLFLQKNGLLAIESGKYFTESLNRLELFSAKKKKKKKKKNNVKVNFSANPYCVTK